LHGLLAFQHIFSLKSSMDSIKLSQSSTVSFNYGIAENLVACLLLFIPTANLTGGIYYNNNNKTHKAKNAQLIEQRELPEFFP
jgi:hypothetical protein